MRVLVFGSLNADHVYLVDHFLQPGETLSSEDLQFFPGGKGLNQAIALKKSGADVSMAGCVGKDSEALLLGALKETGVDISLVRVSEARSGHAIIQNTKDGANNILLFGGTVEGRLIAEWLSARNSCDIVASWCGSFFYI